MFGPIGVDKGRSLALGRLICKRKGGHCPDTSEHIRPHRSSHDWRPQPARSQVLLTRLAANCQVGRCSEALILKARHSGWAGACEGGALQEHPSGAGTFHPQEGGARIITPALQRICLLQRLLLHALRHVTAVSACLEDSGGFDKGCNNCFSLAVSTDACACGRCATSCQHWQEARRQISGPSCCPSCSNVCR